MLDLLLREERTGHRTVKFPRGTIRVEDAMTEKWTHQPVKSLPYSIAQSHSGQVAMDESEPFPNFSKSVANILCGGEQTISF